MAFDDGKLPDLAETKVPENLLHSDSLIRKLVNGIDEADWQDVEIIGWLYQFYIAEKKDQVIGKVVKSEDIPAATQLFTPNWIVKYLVQNSLGRQWLATYPDSPLKQQMEFYIEPAEQTPEVQAQLQAITPESLNPEALTLLDPACGSGHILVEAYDLFKAIYQERGYRARDIPALILQKNLFGLEIDDRAAQLAAFALMMKARADDRRIFANGIQPHVLAIQESKGLNAQQITEALNRPLDAGEKQGQAGHIAQADVAQLIALFEHGKTFGSLIRVPENVAEKLPALAERVQTVLVNGGMLEQAAARSFEPLIEQSHHLAQTYDCVVANPPYMGGRGMMAALKSFAQYRFPDAKSDLFAMFMKHGIALTKPGATMSMVTMQAWMFLSSFEAMRKTILSQATITSMAHLGPRAFAEIGGEIVQVTAFVMRHCVVLDYQAVYKRLIEGSEAEKIRDLTTNAALVYTAKQSDFRSIPGQPIAYWVSKRMRQCFQEGTPLGEIAESRVGLQTGENARFLRRWQEVSYVRAGFRYPSRETAKESRLKWFPYNKGGEFRRWFGNSEWLVNWEDDGQEIKNFTDDTGYLRSRPQSLDCMFRPALTWTNLSSSFFAVRCSDQGFLFDRAGSSIFPPDERRACIAGFLASKIASSMLAVLNPTMHFQVGNIKTLPVLQPQLLARKSAIDAVVHEAVQLARTDWDSSETSWDFQTLPVLQQKAATLSQSQAVTDAEVHTRFQRMKQLEEENNRLFIDAYSLQDELSPEVPDEQITLYRPNREEDIKRLLSYAIGCMMGRYSLDTPGLIYAHSSNHNHGTHGKHERGKGDERDKRDEGNKGDNAEDGKGMIIPLSSDSCIPWSVPWSDGIIPLLETDWFPDDASHGLAEFISVAWPKEHLAENLTFIADSLGPNRSEQPQETIRRYFATGFYKRHLQMYKRRPIYWLFSSGKQRAFQCLVYLHRYHEGTLARMRTEYVIPLQGKIAARTEQLADDIAAASSTAYRKKLEKERDTLRKQHTELQAFDEQLRHYADRRIRLDLDDGVKVNYGKFGDLLAEVKAVTGGSEES